VRKLPDLSEGQQQEGVCKMLAESPSQTATKVFYMEQNIRQQPTQSVYHTEFGVPVFEALMFTKSQVNIECSYIHY
jgi:hypothetical protein